MAMSKVIVIEPWQAPTVDGVYVHEQLNGTHHVYAWHDSRIVCSWGSQEGLEITGEVRNEVRKLNQILSRIQ